MNAIAIIITFLNASLLAGALGGVFLDVPLRGELSSKQRVQTALSQSASERSAEIISVTEKKETLESEMPLLPTKIDEAKQILMIRETELLEKQNEKEKAIGDSIVLQKKKAEKEKEIKNLFRRTFIRGQKGTTVLSATYFAPKTEDLIIQGFTIQDSLRLSDGRAVLKEGSDTELVVSKSIPRLELWNSEKRLGEALIRDDGSYYLWITDDARIVIPAGSSDTFLFKADISSSVLKGERHRFDIAKVSTLTQEGDKGLVYNKNTPIFSIGDSVVSTITLDYLSTETRTFAGENKIFEWSIMNAPVTSKVALVFESTDKKQTVMAKNISPFNRSVKIKIPPKNCPTKTKCLTLAVGSYSIIAYLYEGNNFVLGNKEANAPKILSTSREEAKLRIAE